MGIRSTDSSRKLSISGGLCLDVSGVESSRDLHGRRLEIATWYIGDCNIRFHHFNALPALSLYFPN